MLNVSVRPPYSDIIMEMALDQEPKYRKQYVTALTEAFSGNNKEKQAALAAAIYQDGMKKMNDIDLDDIDESDGDLLSIKRYKTTEDTLNRINQLFDGLDNKYVKLTNELHDIIISYRQDFEHGYRFNIPLTQMIYRSFVLTYYEMINICISQYGAYVAAPVRNNNGGKDPVIVKAAEDIVRMQKRGELQKVFKGLKDPSVAAAAAKESLVRIEHEEPATEGIGEVFTVIAVTASLIWLLMGAIRLIINWFFLKAADFSTYLEAQAKFLEVSINASRNIGHGDSNSIEIQEKWKNRFTSLAEYINLKILKTDQATKMTIQKENRTTFSPANIASTGSDSNIGNFEIM